MAAKTKPSTLVLVGRVGDQEDLARKKVKFQHKKAAAAAAAAAGAPWDCINRKHQGEKSGLKQNIQ